MLFSQPTVNVKRYTAWTAEMFPSSQMIMLDAGVQFGVISSPYATMVMIGANDSGYMVQVAVRHIDNYGSFAPIPYTIKTKGDAFTGYIVFRTHARKFCGGKNIPQNGCMLK